MIKLHKNILSWWKQKLNLSDYSIVVANIHVKGINNWIFNLSFLDLFK